MARGQLVGDAYVRIHADSSAMDRELRQQFKRKAGVTFEQAGKEAAGAFDDGVQSEAKRRRQGRDNDLIRAIVGGRKEWDRQLKESGKSIEEFTKIARARIKTIAGGRAGAPFSKELQDALDGLSKWAKDAKVQQALEKVTKSVRDQDKAWQTYGKNVLHSLDAPTRAIKDQDKAWQTYAANVKHTMDAPIRAIKDQEKAWLTYGKNVKAAMDVPTRLMKAQDEAFRSYANNIREGNRIQKEWEVQVERIHKAVLKQDKAFQSYADNIGKKLPNAFTRLRRRLEGDTAIEAYSKRVGGVLPAALARLDRKLVGSETRFHRFADVLGKAFGKGSRNDFLNFVGSVVGGLARIGTSIAHAAFRVSTFAGTFTHLIGAGVVNLAKGIGGLFTGKGFTGITDALKTAGSGFAELGFTIATTLIGAIGNLIPLLIALAAAFAIMQVALFPLIALIANLAGAIVILAAEISVALAGALLAAAPLALALGGGIAIAVLALKDMAKATKAQKKEMKPVTDAWKGFMKVVQGPAVFGKFFKSLSLFAPLIRNVLTPLAKGFGTALARGISEFAAILSGPRIQPALKALVTTLPVLFGNLAAAVAQFSGGLIEFLEPILPFAEKLSKKILELTTTFADWAASAEGKNAVKTFMENAWQAASDLWGIINDVVTIIGDLISIATGSTEKGGKKKGTFLGSIKEALDGFKAWLESPEGGQAIRDWFTNAKTTVGNLATALGDVGTALSQVDWKSATDTANAFITVTGNITSAFIALGSHGVLSFNLVQSAIVLFGDALREVFNNVIYPVIQGIIGLFIVLLTQFSTLFRVLGKTIPGNDPFDQIADEIDTAITKAAQLSGSIQKIGQTDAKPKITLTITTNYVTKGNKPAAIPGSLTSKLLISAAGSGGGRIINPSNRAMGGIIDAYGNDVTYMASGGVVSARTFIRNNVVAGEAGREAIVPLDRPLQLVDRSVRTLAAIAQGMPHLMAGGGILSGGGTTVESGAIVVNSPNSDPVLVAEAVVDRLASKVRI